MTISRFARTAGVGVETVRYYQRRGLLAVPRQAGGGYRTYGEEQLRRLRFIRRLQAGGFTLGEIRTLIRLDRSDDRLHIQELAARKLVDLKTQMRELRSIARSLELLLEDCRHAHPGTPCPIVDTFDP